MSFNKFKLTLPSLYFNHGEDVDHDHLHKVSPFYDALIIGFCCFVVLGIATSDVL